MSTAPPEWNFLRRLLITIVIIALALGLWQLKSLLLLVFASMLVAMLLRGVSARIHRYLHLPDSLSVVLASIFILLLILGIFWLFGAQIASQLSDLQNRLPQALGRLEERLNIYGIGQVSGELGDLLKDGKVISRITGATAALLGGFGGIILVLAGGFYLALQPRLYLDGLLLLMPEHSRNAISETVTACGKALRQWLKGKFFSMVLVGIATWLALLLIGLPSAMALGLLAGLGEFVPLVGAFVTAIPALLIALTVSPEMVLWTLIVYIIIQQLEGNIIMPLVQERMVSLPPALTLFSVVAAGMLFGLPGVLLATPLAVVLFVGVKRKALGKADAY